MILLSRNLAQNYSPQNHPCLNCNNLGHIYEFDKNKLIVNSELSIPSGALLGFDARNKSFNESVKELFKLHKVDYFEKIKTLTPRSLILSLMVFKLTAKFFRV